MCNETLNQWDIVHRRLVLGFMVISRYSAAGGLTVV